MARRWHTPDQMGYQAAGDRSTLGTGTGVERVRIDSRIRRLSLRNPVDVLPGGRRTFRDSHRLRTRLPYVLRTARPDLVVL